MRRLEIDDPGTDEKKEEGSCCGEETIKNKEIVALGQG
jgi:hypothetical protein